MGPEGEKKQGNNSLFVAVYLGKCSISRKPYEARGVAAPQRCSTQVAVSESYRWPPSINATTKSGPERVKRRVRVSRSACVYVCVSACVTEREIEGGREGGRERVRVRECVSALYDYTCASVHV